MRIIKDIDELKKYILNLDGSIGLVPTMGALHDGHVSLIKKAVDQNDNVVVSVFVNPTQFLPGEDLDKYPKKEQSDIEICNKNGVSAIFMPNANDIYFDDEPNVVAPKKLANILEGATRPGHFDGVLRILTKLFNLIRPNNAYFGKKDAQQLVIVQNMVRTMFCDLKIVPCEIIRQNDGLALSSRNAYLLDEQKIKALAIYKSLQNAKDLILNGNLDVLKIKDSMFEILKDLEIDYVEVVDRKFNKISKIELENSIIVIAARVANTRLIDNIWM